MTKHDPIHNPAKSDEAPSLLERAAQIYDFSRALEERGDAVKQVAEERLPPLPTTPAPPPPVAKTQTVAPTVVMERAKQVVSGDSDQSANAHPPVSRPAPKRERKATGPLAHIDRDLLRESAFIVPEGPVTSISEEFRIVKRRILENCDPDEDGLVIPNAQRILICSAHPNEGKTFCSINLALSIAAEQDNDVLLIDADFAKPNILSALGIEGRKGLMDALTDPSVDVEDCIIATDIRGLSVLPAGQQTNNDTEYLASHRTREVLAQLSEGNPSRILIFDSPPALAASPAAELARHVGQALLVVKADKTSETALKDALNLLSGCENIQLLLNGVKFSPTGRSFGSYYGYGE